MLGNIRALEDAGAAAVVLPSVFEEQIEQEEAEIEAALWAGADSFAEATTYMPADRSATAVHTARWRSSGGPAPRSIFR